MITLEQIQLLEKRVRAAVSRIASLKHENQLLKEELQKYETRFAELEQKISQYKQDQTEIEQGIIAALEQLDHIEDEVVENTDSSSASDSEEPAVPREHEPTANDVPTNDSKQTGTVHETESPSTRRLSDSAPEQDAEGSVEYDEVTVEDGDQDEEKQRQDSSDELDIF